MSRNDFLLRLSKKVEQAMKGWPEWKKNVLNNSFRSTNSEPREVVVSFKDTDNEET